MRLILASSSTARRQLLEQLQLPFDCISPDLDETPRESEKAIELVLRLAIEKAHCIGKHNSNSLVIGCDEVGEVNNTILCKPGNLENSIKQLEMASGNCVSFYTGLCLYNSTTQHTQSIVYQCDVYFKKLSRSQIESYCELEKPFQCAGSLKIEKLGIGLIEKIDCPDPSGLVGIPLIQLIKMLEKEDVRLW